MTANIYLVKIAEMNKAAGDADDNKPSIGRGALVGAGIGTGAGTLVGLGIGNTIGNEMLGKRPYSEGRSIGRKVRSAALEGLRGNRLEGDQAPASRLANRLARGSKTVGEYLVKHPVKGGKAMFTGAMGLAGAGMGAGAGATSGASFQGARLLMNKEAGDTDDKPGFGRGMLVGAGVGAGAGAGAGYVGMGRILAEGSFAGKRDAARIVKDGVRAAKEAGGDSSLNRYFEKHPLRGTHRMGAAAGGLVGAMAGVPVGMAVQGVRRAMHKEAGDASDSPSYLAGLGVGSGVGAAGLGAMAHRRFTKAMLDPHAVIPEHLRGAASKRDLRREMVRQMSEMDMITDGQPIDPKHPLKHLRSMVTKKNAILGGVMGGAAGMGVQGIRSAMQKEAEENRYLLKLAEVDQEPFAARVGRHMVTGAGVGAGLGTLLGTSAVLQGRGSLLVPPVAAVGGALAGGVAGIGTGTASGAYLAHRNWGDAHHKVAEEIPGYFNTLGRWAGTGGQVGGLVGGYTGALTGAVDGFRRGNGIIGRTAGALGKGLAGSMTLGALGAGAGGTLGGAAGGVAGAVNLGRKGVRAIQDTAK